MGVLSLKIKLTVKLILVSGIYFRHSFSGFCPSDSHVCQLRRGVVQSNRCGSCKRIDKNITATVRIRVPRIRGTAHLACVKNSGRLFGARSKGHCSTHCIIVNSAGIFSLLPHPVLVNSPGRALSHPKCIVVSGHVTGLLKNTRRTIGGRFRFRSDPKRACAVKNIFRSMPRGSRLHFRVITSLRNVDG